MKGTEIVGIVNLTEDSFSDGGRYLEPEAAVAHARELFAAGAHLVDLGAASSHPDAKPVDAREEIRRLAPVLSELVAAGRPCAVDSWQPEVQAFALAHGACMLNDIRGFAYPDFYKNLAQSEARLVVMHSLLGGERAVRQNTDPAAVFEALCDFFEERIAALTAAGVTRRRLLLDPGMGFFLGSNPETSLFVLQKLRELGARFALPLYVSVSRKSFLGALTGRDIQERGPASLSAELFAARAGAACIRTHAVGALRDALLVQARLEATPA